MNVAIIFFAAISLAGQTTPYERSLLLAQDLYVKGDLPGSERELLKLAGGPEHSNAHIVATVWSNLGVIYQDQARSADAERAYDKARTLLEAAPGTAESRALWLRTVNNCASMFLETGQIGKAERLIERLKKEDVAEGDDAARIQGTIASYDMVRGRNRESEQRFLSLLDYWHRTGRAREQAVLLNNLGVLAMYRNDPATAAVRLSRSIDLWKQATGEDHPASLTARANYGSALLGIRKQDQAAGVLESALASAKRYYPEASPIVAHLTLAYSGALEATGKKKEAKAMKAEAERMGLALAATDPARHTVDILDLAPRSGRR